MHRLHDNEALRARLYWLHTHRIDNWGHTRVRPTGGEKLKHSSRTWQVSCRWWQEV
jgi:hypothetical protein